MKGDIHVLPENDLMQHEQIRQCPCRPTLEIQPNGVAVVIHHAADGREYSEPDRAKESIQ